MKYKKEMESILSKHDLQQEEGRKAAYQECSRFAENAIADNKAFNDFMKRAAKKLDQVPVRKDLTKGGIRETGQEKLHLTYSQETGPVLTGNKEGLNYLSQIVQQLSALETPGEHTHFYMGEHPLFGDSYPLTVYYEDEAWFWRYSKRTPEEKEYKIPERSIDPVGIHAFLIMDPVPPTMPFSGNKVYLVQSVERYKDQAVWIKRIREELTRVYVVTFINDQGQPFRYGIDLDDQSVVLLRREDCQQLNR